MPTPVISGSYSERGGPYMPVYFVLTDAGRSTSKRTKQRNDCTVRALASVTGLDYDRVYETLASSGRKCGARFDFRQWTLTNTLAGYRFEWVSFPAVKGQTRMNPAKFCKQFPTGKYIVRTAKHVMAVIDGAFYDDGSPSPDRCIYGAWRVIELH